MPVARPAHRNRTASCLRDAAKITMQNDERSGDQRDEGTVMFGVAHGLQPLATTRWRPRVRVFSKI